MKPGTNGATTMLAGEHGRSGVSRRALLGRGAALGLGGALAGSSLRGMPAMAQGDPQAPLDLPAMTIRPEDLAAAGIDGFGLRDGHWLSLDWLTDYVGLPPELTRQSLEAAGLARGFRIFQDVPLDPENPDSGSDRTILVHIFEYADATGAQAGFDFFEPEGERVPVQSALGDAVRVTSLPTWSDLEYDDLGGQAMEYAFVAGRIHASATVVNLAPPGGIQGVPGIDEVTTIGALLEQRVLSGMLAGTPQLGTRILRFEGDPGLGHESDGFGLMYDRYERIGSAPIATYGWQARPDDPAREALNAGIVDLYDMEYGFYDDVQQDIGAYLEIRLVRFADAATASAWITNPGTLASTTGEADVAVPAPSPAAGDESVAITLRINQPTSIGEVSRAAVRLGDTVVQVNGYFSFVESGEPVPAPVATVTSVIEAQALQLQSNTWFPVIAPPQDLLV